MSGCFVHLGDQHDHRQKTSESYNAKGNNNATGPNSKVAVTAETLIQKTIEEVERGSGSPEEKNKVIKALKAMGNHPLVNTALSAALGAML